MALYESVRPKALYQTTLRRLYLASLQLLHLLQAAAVAAVEGLRHYVRPLCKGFTNPHCKSHIFIYSALEITRFALNV